MDATTATIKQDLPNKPETSPIEDEPSTTLPDSAIVEETQTADLEIGGVVMDADEKGQPAAPSILSLGEISEKSHATESCRTHLFRYGAIFGTFGTIMLLHYFVL